MKYSKKYGIAIFLTLCLIVATQAIIQYMLSQKKYDSKIINISGKQRMLSQRLLMLTYDFQSNKSDTIKTEITTLYTEWRAVHQGFINGSQALDIKPQSKAVKSKLIRLTPYVNKALEVIQKGDLTTKQLRAFLNDQTAFLTGMDEVVNDLEKEADSKLYYIVRIQFGLHALLLLVILAEYLLIFRPAIKEISNNNKQLTYQKQQLEEQTTDLQHSNQTLEQFIYIASHDLQEPLRMVGNFVQLLEEELKDSITKEQKNYINYAVKGVTRMSQLMDDLLHYLQIRKIDQNLLITNINTIVSKQLDSLSDTISETQANIMVDTLPKKIVCEPSQIGVVFYNLISNAIKFNTTTSPKVWISVEEQESKYIFQIRDNGIGISEQHLEKIFGAFKRLNRKEKFEGTGMGLTLVKRIILNHKGKIWIESEVGKGTTVFFTLPK